MTGIYAIIGIVMLVFGILQIVLFFKLWGMTNDVGQIKGLLSINSKSHRCNEFS